MGLEMAVDEINQDGGVNGKEIELVYEDSQTQPAHAVRAYRKLIDQGNVDAVIGDVWSILTNPLIPLSKYDKTPFISPTVMDAAIQEESPYFFTMGHRIESIRAPVEQFFSLNTDIQSVAFLCWEDAWGRANLTIWQEVAKSRNIKITDTVCQGDYTNDFRTDVTRISKGKPDAVIVAMYGERVLQRLHEQQLDVKVLSTNCILEAVNNQEVLPELFNGLYITYWNADKQFREAFKKRYGEEPILEAHNHYEVLHAIVKGHQQNPNDLLSGLRSLKYTGVSGQIDFTKAPFVNRSEGSLLMVKNGKLKQVSRTH